MQLIIQDNDDDDYEYGIEHIDYSLKMKQINNFKLKNNEIINRFWIPFNGGNLKDFTKREIYSTYSHMYVLCMSKHFANQQNSLKIFDRALNATTISEISKYFALVKTTNLLIKTEKHYLNGLIVKSDFLELFFKYTDFKDIVFNPTEVVIPMFELNEMSLDLYISLYDKTANLSDLKNILCMVQHFTPKFQYHIEEQIKNMILNVRETKYWSTAANCLLNSTEQFDSREFNSQVYNTLISVQSVNNQNVTKTVTIEEESKYTDYENCLNNVLEVANPTEKKRTFYPTHDKSITVNKISIDMIMEKLSDKELFLFSNALLASKDYCHLIVNNLNALNKLNKLFETHKSAYRYSFGYAWLTLFLEETMIKTNTTVANRYIFDIHTASKLPYFPISFDDPKINPYVTILIDDKNLNLKQNCMSLQPIENYDGYGVVDFETFKWRFNLFTSGDSNIDIFKGIDWKYFAVSGSIMPACLQKKSPLILLHEDPKAPDEVNAFKKYLQTYYGDSDVDIMCNAESIFDFLKLSSTMFEKIRVNANCGKDLHFIPTRTTGITFTKFFFDTCLENFNDITGNSWDEDTFIENIKSSSVRHYFNAKYSSSKLEANFKLIKNKNNVDSDGFINAYLNPSHINDLSLHHDKLLTILQKDCKVSDSDIYLFVNDFKSPINQVPATENYLVIKIKDSIKFKIYSDKFPRSIELFRTRKEDFFSMVARFHLPIVRAFYQGDNVYMTPSCITAISTGLNIEYNYYQGIKDPINIVNKYMTRGYGTYLNIVEIGYWLSHNYEHGNGAFKSESKVSTKNLGQKTLDNPIFLVNNMQKNKLKYVNSIDDVKRIYKTTGKYLPDNGIDILKFRTILSNGNVSPFNPHILELYYDTNN